MTTRPITILLLTLLSASCWAQSIPYVTVQTLEDCAKEFRKVAETTAEIRLQHSDGADTRSFRLTLETPDGVKGIAVGEDGTFHLPQVAPAIREASLVRHSLEKGALTLSFKYGFHATLPGTQRWEGSLLTMCTEWGGFFGEKVGRLFAKVGTISPDFTDFKIGVVGVSLAREKPCAGFALLKNGERIVASIDLSRAGKASWMFAEYEPGTHRIVWDMKNNEPAPSVDLELLFGKGLDVQKHAVIVRLGK